MRQSLKYAGYGCAAAVLAFGLYLGGIQLSGNFSTVKAGEAYRSNQPTPTQIASYSRDYGIKTIINLRGSNEKAKWYRDEVAAAAQLGINHIDFRMSAGRQLKPDETRKLIALLREAPKPILIHCKSGSDRTGLVSAVYLNQLAGADDETAEKQLSIRFGHFSVPYLSSAYAMDENWEKLEKDLKVPDFDRG